jgi:hypothetical protein
MAQLFVTPELMAFGIENAVSEAVCHGTTKPFSRPLAKEKSSDPKNSQEKIKAHFKQEPQRPGTVRPCSKGVPT